VYSRIGERCLQDVKAVIDADGGHKVLIESCEMRWRDAYRATPLVSGVVLAKISLDTTAGRPIGHSGKILAAAFCGCTWEYSQYDQFAHLQGSCFAFCLHLIRNVSLYTHSPTRSFSIISSPSSSIWNRSVDYDRSDDDASPSPPRSPFTATFSTPPPASILTNNVREVPGGVGKHLEDL
jgi:hypothetical protein